MKGTCLQYFVPMRKLPESSAEMVSCLIFGESYDVLQTENDWLFIHTHFDNYEGWISKTNYFDYQGWNAINENFELKAKSKEQHLAIPTAAAIPCSGTFSISDNLFHIEPFLKSTTHLPIDIRIINLCKNFMNTPYLWGGRTRMGIDCSGLVQIIFKANHISLPRDTGQQIKVGTTILNKNLKVGDLVFFSKPELNKVSHVGIMVSATEIVHSSGWVKKQQLHNEGIIENNKLVYETLQIQRVLE